MIDATGVLKGRRRRALDSTVVDDTVATQDTVTQLVSAVRRVRKLVPAAAAVTVTGHDYDQRGKPACTWDDPAAREALATALVTDATAVLAAVEDVELDAAQADAVGAGPGRRPRRRTGRRRRDVADHPRNRQRPGDLHRRR